MTTLIILFCELLKTFNSCVFFQKIFDWSFSKKFTSLFNNPNSFLRAITLLSIDEDTPSTLIAVIGPLLVKSFNEN